MLPFINHHNFVRYGSFYSNFFFFIVSFISASVVDHPRHSHPWMPSNEPGVYPFGARSDPFISLNLLLVSSVGNWEMRLSLYSSAIFHPSCAAKTIGWRFCLFTFWFINNRKRKDLFTLNTISSALITKSASLGLFFFVCDL